MIVRDAEAKIGSMIDNLKAVHPELEASQIARSPWQESGANCQVSVGGLSFSIYCQDGPQHQPGVPTFYIHNPTENQIAEIIDVMKRK